MFFVFFSSFYFVLPVYETERKYQPTAGSVLSNHLEKRPAPEKENANVEKESLSICGLSNQVGASTPPSLSSSSNSFTAFTSQTAPSGGVSVDVSSIRVSAQPAPAISYNLGHMGAGSNAIAAAASQAIAATQQVCLVRLCSKLRYILSLFYCCESLSSIADAAREKNS